MQQKTTRKQKKKGPIGQTATGSVSATVTQTQALQQVATQFTAIVAILNWLTTMSAAARKVIFRAHVGWEPLAAALAQLVLGNPSLCPAGLDPQALLDDLDNIKALEALHNQLLPLLQAIGDTLLVRRSEAFKNANDIYTLNLVNARTNPALSQDLAAFEAFLAKSTTMKAKAAKAAKAKAGKKGAAAAGSTTASTGGSSTGAAGAPTAGGSTSGTGSSTAGTGSGTGSTGNGAGNSVPVYGPNGLITP